jgi:cytochrome c-type biogenesis protein CcmE
MRARTRRLNVVFFAGLLLLVAAGLAFMALQQSANLFYTPTALAERGGPEPGLTGKVGGFVEVGSLTYTKGTQFTFRVVDDLHAIRVEYDGIAPALFQEGAGVVAEGQFNAEGRFIASRLLAKHDENYVPRELANVESPDT